MRPLRTLLATALLAALPAPAAADVALHDDPRAQDVALAGRDVLVARAGDGGAIAVDAVALDGGGVRPLLRAASPGRGWRAELTLAASPEQVALLAELRDGHGALESRVYAGPPAGPLTLVRRARGERPGTWAPIVLDADGPHLLVTEFELYSERLRSLVLQPGLAPTPVPLPSARSAALALAGDLAAILGPLRPGRPPGQVRVVQWRTGALSSTRAVPHPAFVDAPRPLDLTADGGLVVAMDGVLSAAAAGGPLRDVPGRAFRAAPAFAGHGSIAAIEQVGVDRQPVLVVPGSGAAQPLGARTGVLERLAADSTGVAWLANGCVRYAAVTGPQPTGPPSDPCPAAELALIETDSRLRGARARVRARCVRAPGDVCRGTAIVRRGEVSGEGPVVARGRFAVRVGGWRRVDVRFERRALRSLRRALRRRDFPLLTVSARVEDGRVGAGALGSGLTLRRR